MRTSFTRLVAVLTVAAVGLTTSHAFADSGGKKGGKKGGFGISFNHGGVGVSFHQLDHHKKFYHHNKYYHNHCDYYGGYVYVQPYSLACEPFHCWYICQPGDTFYSVALMEYGTSAADKYIARFNRLPLNAALVPGQRLMLPSVSANGTMSLSRAPAPVVDVTPQIPFAAPPARLAQPTTIADSSPAANVSVVPSEPALPRITVGSTLVLDGSVFGEERGIGRLRISGLSLPVDVLEWSNSSAKIRLPQVELNTATKAEIELMRADGSVASKSAIELTPAAVRLALEN